MLMMIFIRLVYVNYRCPFVTIESPSLPQSVASVYDYIDICMFIPEVLTLDLPSISSRVSMILTFQRMRCERRQQETLPTFFSLLVRPVYASGRRGFDYQMGQLSTMTCYGRMRSLWRT